MLPVMHIMKIDRPIGHSVFEFLLQFVTEEKKERILRQRVKQNADLMLAGAVMAGYLIFKEFGIPLSEQCIGYGAHGKPYLKDYPDVHFNISHSGQFVVCAVGKCPLGIDIQTIGTYKEEVAQRVCCSAELQQIAAASDPALEFTKIWTMKESYLKMTGMGITQELRLIDTTKLKEKIFTIVEQGYCISLASAERFSEGEICII